MRTKILVAAMLFNLSVNAQESNRKILGGVKAGIIINMLSPDNADSVGNTYDYQPKANLIIGVRGEIPIGNKVLLLPEITLHDKFSKEKIRYNNSYYYGDTYYNYGPSEYFLEFTSNILFALSSGKGRTELGGGPSVSINLSGYPQLTNGDYGFNFLIRHKFPIGFSAELNFNKGLKNQAGSFSGSPYSYLGKQAPKTSCIGVCIGYTF
jgi:hypothetical protein